MAGLFGLFDFSKEGPGVSKNHPKKKRFFFFWELYFRKFWKLVTLNLLYFALCLPIVTIGPATAGFFYVLRKLVNEEPVFLVSDFFEAFRKNWKQSVAVFVLDILLFAMLPFAVSFYSAQTQLEGSANWFFYLPMALCAGALIIYAMMHCYIHLLIVTTNLKLKHILKNSFLLSSVALKTNLLTALFVILIVVAYAALAIFFIPAIMLFPLIILSTVGFVVSFNSYQYIIKYVIEPFYRDMPIEEVPEQIRRTLHLDEDEEEADTEEESDVIFRDMGREEPAPSSQKNRTKSGGKKNKTIS